ncbi:MAG: CCA tRNA nucleotidyltransferase [Candidatus Sumerlaeia bacterium]
MTDSNDRSKHDSTGALTEKRRRATAVVKRLQEAGHEAYWVGGCVRDMLRGLAPEDYDVATSARPEVIQALFPHTRSVGAAFGVILVVDEPWQFEIATFRKDAPYTDHRHPVNVEYGTLEEDARRRDFTINALYFDPITRRVIDLVGGQVDLEARVLRTVGVPEERFWEDALRLMRAVRFGAILEFEIEAHTWAALCSNVRLIRYVSAERIRDELNRMLIHPNRRRALELLMASGLLEVILPEVAAMKGVEQPAAYHPEGDVWTHTLLTMEHLGGNPGLELVWAALLHDVGKPPTFERASDRIRFNNHQIVGEQLALQILNRLKFPRAVALRIAAMVRRHMDFINVRQMRRSTLRRFLSAETITDELALHRADCLASHGDLQNLDFCRTRIKEFEQEHVPLLPPPLITGKDLIRLGYIPGPVFSKILDDVMTRQLDEELKSPEDAEKYVREKYPMNTSD